MTNIINNPPSRVGLVGEWLLDGNALDTSGNGLTGTNTNGVYVKTYKGYQNQAWQGNGTNARIQVSDNAVFPSGGNFSINIWVNPTALPTSGNLVSIVSKYDGGANKGGYDIQLYNNAGTQQLIGLFNNSSGNGQTTGLNHTLTTGQWCMLTYLLSGSTGYLYKDGVLLTSSSVTGTPFDNTKLFNIGNFGYYTPSAGELGRYFNGQIQGVRIYNRAISQDEIQLLYLEGQKKLGPTNIAKYPSLLSGLVYYADFKGTAHNLIDGVAGTNSNVTTGTDHLGNSGILNTYNGSNAYIQVSNSILSGFSQTSWCAWIKTSTSNADMSIFESNNINAVYTLRILNGGTIFWRVYAGGSHSNINPSGNKADGNWHFVVGTRNGSNMYLYWDGVQIGTVAKSGTAGTLDSSMNIGRFPTGVQYFNGGIEMPIVMNKALSADEVKLLYNLTSQDYIYPTPSYDLANLRDGLVLDLNEQGKDLSGNGNNGTLVNSPTVVRQGKAKGLSYNGSSQYQYLASDLTGLKTISLFISKSDISNSTNMLFTKTSGETYIGQIHSNGIFYCNLGGGNLTPSHGISSNNTIYNITITTDGTNLRLYNNGVLLSTVATTLHLFIRNIATGNNGWYSGYYYGGKIFGIKAYNRTLTTKEIESLYYSQKGNFIY